MPGEKEKFVPTCPLPMDRLSTKVPMGTVTTDGIATLSQQEFGPIMANINALNADVQMLDAKYGDLMGFEKCSGKSAERHGGPHGRHAHSGY